MNTNRRDVLKKVFFSGVCVALPLSSFTLINREGDLMYQSKLIINNIDDDMYEIDGWIVPLSDIT